ncbi:MAG: hypothetical protein D6796_09050 [Caldilineae bacterium]|nr:MAG: hypothetical protein D6796_09050 [Caldilineae bacterium]
MNDNDNGFFQVRPDLCRFLDTNTQKAGLRLFLDLTPINSRDTLLAHRYCCDGAGGPALHLTLTQARMNGNLRLFIHSEVVRPDGTHQNLVSPLLSAGWNPAQPELSASIACALLQRVLRAWQAYRQGSLLQQRISKHRQWQTCS